MIIHKIAPVLYTHCLSKSLEFYIQETAWFKLDVDFGLNCVRLQSNCHENLFLHIDEKTDYDYWVIIKPCLYFYVDNLDEEYERLQHVNFISGAKFANNFGTGIFECPAGRNFTLLDPTGNKIILADNRYM